MLSFLNDKVLNLVITQYPLSFFLLGWSSLLDAFQIRPGSISSCVDDVNAGHILTISPGGVREAQFSDHTYQTIWGKRTGFAKVAIETNCVCFLAFFRHIYYHKDLFISSPFSQNLGVALSALRKEGISASLSSYASGKIWCLMCAITKVGCVLSVLWVHRGGGAKRPKHAPSMHSKLSRKQA